MKLVRHIARLFLPIGFVVIFIIILIAGLWPFRISPPNRISWLMPGPGLRFTRTSLVRSEEPLNLPNPASNDVSLEIWLQPVPRQPSPTLLTIYSQERKVSLRLMIYEEYLVIRRYVTISPGRQKKFEVDVADLVHPGRPTLVTIASSQRGTSVYYDGALAQSFPQYRLSRQDFCGELILGTTPRDYSHWEGDLRGIAIYNAGLSAQQALEHFHAWTGPSPERTLLGDFPYALYTFQDGSGPVARNAVVGAPDLVLPSRFTVPHKAVLELFWRDVHLNWSYTQDVVLNILGFVPFGLFAYALFAHNSTPTRAVWLAFLFGCAVSFFIEATQAFMPTRDSDTTDLINNAAGSAIGAFLGLKTHFERAPEWIVKWFGKSR